MLVQPKNKSGKKYTRSTQSSRGYLGPIGDDIPSLIPIIVGMITFFAAFTFTLNEYNQRSASFSADRDTLIIANALKGDSYLSTFQEFDDACKGIHVRGLNYFAGIVDSSQWNKIIQDTRQNQQAGGSYHQLSFVADHIFPIGNNPLLCSTGLATPVDADILSQALRDHQYVVLSLPIALEIPTAVVPGTLVVITWRAS
ncbi:MAG: hypothetical protein FJY86_04115 [Candidatus Diapherotrites archaeon]|uniref:Uncharacterized protein n=1 Tax=Candidatus Iainarchaeum sp. TaxID=3101447 RepID=A0A8T4C8E7_9ARCH|nr:hypothetical protein [Candidatus Diapherotrites archaeon]